MDKFKGTVSKTYVTVKDKWSGISGKMRIIILSTALGVIVSAIVLTAILNRSGANMLVRASDRDEALQIQMALANEGITVQRINRDHEIFVSERDEILALIAMHEAGLPRPGSNYDIWRDSVNMFSTESQQREAQKQQLENRIERYLNAIRQVDSSLVILHIPKTRNYVMTEGREEPRAGVQVFLRPGEILTNTQVEGIYLFVRNSVPGLDERNITLTDNNGIFLIPGEDDPLDPNSQLATLQRRMAMEIEIKELMAENAYRTLEPMLRGIFGEGNYVIGVTVDVDFSTDREVEQEWYFPIEGENHGVVRNVLESVAAGGTAADGDGVGTFNNAEIAPGHPTLPNIAPDGEFFYESIKEVNYEISRRMESYKDDGLRITNVSASVVVNREEMTGARRDDWREIVAFALRAPVENVAFLTEIFEIPAIPPPLSQEGGVTVSSILIWIIVCLGILLIILSFYMFTASSSHKKRFVRARGYVPVADGPTGYLRDDSFRPQLDETSTGFESMTSLLDENETKDVVLRREIREFTRSNPEIIAQLIRTWLRDSD